MVRQFVQYSFGILQHEFVTEISLSIQSNSSGEINLAYDFIYFPVLLFRVKKIDSQSGYYPTFILVFFPVECKRVEVISWKYIMGKSAS